MTRKGVSARRAARSRASSEKRKVGSPCFGGTVRAAVVIGWHPFTGVTLQGASGQARLQHDISLGEASDKLQSCALCPRPRRGCRLASTSIMVFGGGSRLATGRDDAAATVVD